MITSGGSKFSRWSYPWPITWALYVFRQHHTQINSLLWSHHSGSRRAASIAHSVGLMNPAIKAFPAAVSDPGRQAKSLDEWLSLYKEFDNWTRLSACLSICSYFETYLHGIVSLSILSDPGAFLGRPHSVDGIYYIKSGIDFPLDMKKLSQTITKGTWDERILGFERLFGSCPDLMRKNVAELDQMRILRNKVGHRFGRSLEDLNEDPLAALDESERLSAARIKKWLAIVEMVAVATDKQLRDKHIGSFEPLRRCGRAKADVYSKVLLSKRISSYFPATHGYQLNKKYCADLVDYYDKLKA